MIRDKKIKLLMMDGCTKSEAEKFLKKGSVIFEDFEEHIEDYLEEWDIEEEDKEEYRKMLVDKIPAKDSWRLTNYTVEEYNKLFENVKSGKIEVSNDTKNKPTTSIKVDYQN